MRDDLKSHLKKEAAARRREALRAKAIEHLGGCCSICGYHSSPAAFDFHHIDPMSKSFNISAATSWKRALPELAKCVLLCANCHREVHDGLHPGCLDDGYDGGGSWTDELDESDT